MILGEVWLKKRLLAAVLYYVSENYVCYIAKRIHILTIFLQKNYVNIIDEKWNENYNILNKSQKKYLDYWVSN